MPLAARSNVNTPEPSVDSPVIFLPTTRFAFDKFISDTFLLPNSAYNPLFSFKLILVTPNENVVDFVAPVGNAPLHIPVTLAIGSNVIDNPVESTIPILLNLSVASSGNWYLTIVSVLIPAKLLPATVAIPVTPIFNSSVILKPVGIFLCRTVSATKSSAYPLKAD